MKYPRAIIAFALLLWGCKRGAALTRRAANMLMLALAILTLIAILSCGVAVWAKPVMLHPVIPVITSHSSLATVTVDENLTFVASITFTPSTASLSVAGTDSSLFEIRETGDDGKALHFITASDYETPGDVGTNNVYNVSVIATLGSRTDTTEFAVTVADVDEGTPGGDMTAPTLSTATINSAGTTLTIGWSENVTGSTGLSLSPSGSLASLSYASGSGTSTYTYSISRTILDEETVTISASSSNIVDGATNTLANFTGTSVTNNSTQVAGTGTSLRPAIFPTIPSQATDAGFAQNDLSTSVRTDVVGTTRAAVVEIAAGTYSTPYTASTANREIKLMGNVTYETAGINVNANNVTVNLNGYTLTYKSVGPASVATATVSTASDPSYPTITQTGLTLSSNSHYTFVVEFLTGAEAGNFYEVRDNSASSLTLENHTGSNGAAWEDGGPANGDTFRIYNSRLTGGVLATNRSGLEVINGYIVEGDGYGRGSNIRAGQGCNPIFWNSSSGMIGGVSVTWHADNAGGIFTGNSSTIKYCEIDDQGTLTTNRQRTIGAVVPGSSSTIQYCRFHNHRHAGIHCGSNNVIEYIEMFGDSRATNAYGIGTYGGQGNIFRYCNVYKTGEHPIGIAIHSNPAQNNEVHNIWAESKTTRASEEYPWNYSVGLSDRWDNGGRTLANSIHDSCFITWSADGAGPNEESRGRTLFLGSLSTSPGEVFENVFAGAYSTDDETECHAIGLSTHNSNVVFRDCTFASTHNPFWFGDTYGPATSGGRFIDCTALKSGSDPAFATFKLWDYYACNVDMIGTTFGTGTAEDDIDLLANAVSPAAQRINFGATLGVTVTESAVPVSAATVAIRDASSNTLRSGYLTNGSGFVEVDVPFNYRARPGFGSTTLNPLTVEAVNGASDGTNTISPTGDDTISVGIAP